MRPQPVRKLFVASVALTFVLAFISTVVTYHLGQAGVASVLQQLDPYLLGWRGVLLGVVIMFWPQISLWFVRRLQLDEQVLQLAIRMRWGLACTLLLVTLLPYLRYRR